MQNDMLMMLITMTLLRNQNKEDDNLFQAAFPTECQLHVSFSDLTIEKVSEKQLIVFLDETNPSQT
jgi:hypothetical protein